MLLKPTYCAVFTLRRMEKLKAEMTDQVSGVLAWLFDTELSVHDPHLDEEDILSRHIAEMGDRFDYLADK